MLRYIFALGLVCIISENVIDGCLITNCPRGGKRSGKLHSLDANIRQCIACGPGRTGQCFGPTICCGPFGCLLGTPETFRCQREGQFQETEPCIAGNSSCRRNTGRCATDGICCSQDSCHADKTCSVEEKQPRDLIPLEVYNLFGYPNIPEYTSE